MVMSASRDGLHQMALEEDYGAAVAGEQSYCKGSHPNISFTDTFAVSESA
jgi:hypothetical protein